MRYRRIAISLFLLAANIAPANAWTTLRDEFDPEVDPYYVMKPQDDSLGWSKQEIEKQNVKLAKMAVAIAADPKNSKLFLERANYNFELKKLEAAKSDYGQAIEFDPTLATAYYHRGKVCEYLALQKSTLYGMDFSAKSLNTYGVKLDEQEDWPTAIKVLRLAIIRDPKNEVYRRNLCRVHDRYGDYFLNLKQPTKAAEEYRLALDVDKNHQQAKYRLKHVNLPKNFKLVPVADYPLSSELLEDYKSQVSATKELYAAALYNYMKAAELAPQNAKPHFRRAKVGEKNSSIDIADEYSKAIQLDKNNAVYFMGRAKVFNAIGNLDAAYTDYSAAIDLISKLPKPPLQSQNQIAPSEANSKAVEAVVKRDDFSDGADETKTMQYMTKDEFEASKNEEPPKLTAAELEQIDKNSEMELNAIRESDAFYERGVLLMKQQKFQEAKADFTNAIAARGDNDDAFEKRSQVLSRSGNKIDAEADMQSALRIRAGDKFSGSTWSPIEKF